MNEEERFLDLGSQYYIAGRFACFAGLFPIVGNLLHHAVEMFLKAYLCRSMDERQRRTISHSLAAAWDHFKRGTGGQNLSQLDWIVTELDRFSELRYPETVDAWAGGCSVKRGAMPGFLSIERPPYVLVLGEIDTLVRTILESADLKPWVASRLFMSPADSITSEARDALTRENRAAPFWSE